MVATRAATANILSFTTKIQDIREIRQRDRGFEVRQEGRPGFRGGGV